VGVTFFQPCKYFEKFIVPENLPALLYAAKVVRTPYMTPAGPDVIGLAVSSDRVSAGTPVTLTAIADDTRYQNSNGEEPSQAIAAAEYYVDVPPWNAGAVAAGMDASDGGFDAAVENVEATIGTTGWKNGKHIVFVRAQDQDGNWGAFSAVFMSLYGP
jgi:predicted transcriptional regulator